MLVHLWVLFYSFLILDSLPTASESSLPSSLIIGGEKKGYVFPTCMCVYIYISRAKSASQEERLQDWTEHLKNVFGNPSEKKSKAEKFQASMKYFLKYGRRNLVTYFDYANHLMIENVKLSFWVQFIALDIVVIFPLLYNVIRYWGSNSSKCGVSLHWHYSRVRSDPK